MKKYRLTSETKLLFGRALYRIEAAVDMKFARKGDKGGWVESEKNLSHDDSAWVSGSARVYGNARVSPINITGLAYNVTFADTHAGIGCEFHSYVEWMAFDERQIAEMDGEKAVKFWRAHKDTLIAIARANGRVEKEGS